MIKKCDPKERGKKKLCIIRVLRKALSFSFESETGSSRTLPGKWWPLD